MRTAQFVEEHQPLSMLSSNLVAMETVPGMENPASPSSWDLQSPFLKQVSALSQSQRTTLPVSSWWLLIRAPVLIKTLNKWVLCLTWPSTKLHVRHHSSLSSSLFDLFTKKIFWNDLNNETFLLPYLVTLFLVLWHHILPKLWCCFLWIFKWNPC